MRNFIQQIMHFILKHYQIGVNDVEYEVGIKMLLLCYCKCDQSNSIIQVGRSNHFTYQMQ